MISRQMKKILTIIFLFSFLFLVPSPTIKAQDNQEFNFDRAYQDYLFTYNQYRQAHNEYVTAREQYLNYKTLTAKTLALEQTLKMLQERDNTIRTYLTALRMKMAETTGILNYKQNTLYLQLDAEVAWYVNHRDSLSSAASLEDLTKLSKETEERYGKTQVLIYQGLGIILEGKENNLKNQINDQIQILKEKITEIREKGDKDTTIAERWLLEAENKLTRAQEKIDEANGLLNSLKAFDQDKQEDYNQAQNLYQEAHLYLKEANSFLKELVREIKTAD